MLDKKKALKWLCIFMAAGLFLSAAVTFVFDPFYQYHTPWFGLKQVLNDRDNQVIGTIRNNSYDSVLLGSSVAENFDSSFLDRQYGCQTLKIIRASGSVADLMYYMEKAHKRQELVNVFWCMDIFALTASTEVTLYSDETPRYLHTDTILDDAVYLFNKDILFETIPQTLVFSVMGKNTGGQAYNWAEGKEFDAAQAMQAYAKPEIQEPPESTVPEEFKQLLAENIAMVRQEIAEHPQTQYTILFPPYSMLWWDSGYVNGVGEQYFYAIQEVLPVLLSYENVKVYYFQAEREIVCNLDNYMDMIHYSPEINQYMLDCVAADEHRVTEQNWQQTVQEMRDTYAYITEDGIYSYYEGTAFSEVGF